MQQDSSNYLVNHYSALGDFDKDFRNANLFRLITSLVTGPAVVDIGCGAGFFLNMLASKGKEVLGVEPDPGMRALAEKIHPGMKVVAGSAEEIDQLIHNPISTVTMLDVLEHVEDDDTQVGRVSRVLARDGSFILVVPAYPLLYGKRDESMGHYRRYTKKSLTRLLTTHGFVIEQVRYWNALGVLPYIISEKVLRRPLQVKLREAGEKGMVSKLLWKILDTWMRAFENRFSVGFGLSIICVARKVS